MKDFDTNYESGSSKGVHYEAHFYGKSYVG